MDTQIGTLKVQESNYPYSLSGDVTILERAPDRTTVAAGYSGGELRILNYISKEVVATFRGHRSAVSSIAFERHGSTVASGGSDSDIFLWDLVTLTGEEEQSRAQQISDAEVLTDNELVDTHRDRQTIRAQSDLIFSSSICFCDRNS